MIKSLGTNKGIGIKNENGTFNFYDGKVQASNTPLPEIPNGIEYLYETVEYTDDDNNKYCILEWMR